MTVNRFLHRNSDIESYGRIATTWFFLVILIVHGHGHIIIILGAASRTILGRRFFYFWRRVLLACKSDDVGSLLHIDNWHDLHQQYERLVVDLSLSNEQSTAESAYTGSHEKEKSMRRDEKVLDSVCILETDPRVQGCLRKRGGRNGGTVKRSFSVSNCGRYSRSRGNLASGVCCMKVSSGHSKVRGWNDLPGTTYCTGTLDQLEAKNENLQRPEGRDSCEVFRMYVRLTRKLCEVVPPVRTF